MTPNQALNIVHQVRMKYECNGESGDIIREAFLVLRGLVEAQQKAVDTPGEPPTQSPNETPKT